MQRNRVALKRDTVTQVGGVCVCRVTRKHASVRFGLVFGFYRVPVRRVPVDGCVAVGRVRVRIAPTGHLFTVVSALVPHRMRRPLACVLNPQRNARRSRRSAVLQFAPRPSRHPTPGKVKSDRPIRHRAPLPLRTGTRSQLAPHANTTKDDMHMATSLSLPRGHLPVSHPWVQKRVGVPARRAVLSRVSRTQAS